MSVLTLAQAKVYLRLTPAPGADDTELQAAIDSAEETIAERCGPLAATSKTDRIQTDGRSLVLETVPAISLTTVTGVNPATTVTIGDLDLDEPVGLVTYADGIGRFQSELYVVTYQAGYSSLPEDLLNGIKELVRHRWKPQRGGMNRPGTAADEANDEAEMIDDLPASVYHLVKRYLIDEQGFA